MEETNEPRTKEITHTGYPTKHPGRIVDCDLCMRGGEVERVGLVVSKEQADQLDKVFEDFTRHMLSESEPYRNMSNKELRALAVDEITEVFFPVVNQKEDQNERETVEEQE